MKKIKIMIADDHQLFRKGLVSLFEDVEDYNIIDQASDGEELIKKLKNKVPDVILLDLKMPGISSLDIIKHIQNNYPDVKILALTMFSNEITITTVMEKGIGGYLLKTIDFKDLLKAIDEVMNGEIGLDPIILSKVKNNLSKNLRPFQSNSLSAFEIRILKLICQGLNSEDISIEVSKSVRTIENTRKKMLGKFKAPNVAAMVKIAISEGLVDDL